MFNQEERDESNVADSESVNQEGGENLIDGPDTSSFTAFLYSLLSSSDAGENAKSDGQNDNKSGTDIPPPESAIKENSGKRSLFSRGKQSLGRAIQAVRISGFRHQERKDDFEMKLDHGHGSKVSGVEMKHIQPVEEPMPLVDLPEISEPSMLLSEKTRNVLYASLPALMHGRKWILLYR